jgi:phosphoribosylaminoimidazolecarboxamide formyltransferase/IMP cyclohydrolase
VCSKRCADHDGSVPLALRRELAALAFARTAAYDAAVSGWFATELALEAPRHRAFGGRLLDVMRYGENPHQAAAFYSNGEQRPGVATATLLQGKQLSYNNINDTDAAFELVSEFDRDRAACAIIKHANPCGVAVGDSLVEAYRRALDCDQTSAFGGIIALNRTLDARDGDGNRQAVHRGDHCPGRERGSEGNPLGEKEPAPDGHR